MSEWVDGSMDESMRAVGNWMAGSMVGLTAVLKVESMVGSADYSRGESID